MEIWILVIALLVIGILFLLISLFTRRDNSIDDQLNEFSVSQSEELYQIKSRLQALEESHYANNDNYLEASENHVDEDYSDSDSSVNDNKMEEIIRLYSQGYTMHEIGQAVNKDVETIQTIIDDYIENR